MTCEICFVYNFRIKGLFNLIFFLTFEFITISVPLKYDIATMALLVKTLLLDLQTANIKLQNNTQSCKWQLCIYKLQLLGTSRCSKYLFHEYFAEIYSCIRSCIKYVMNCALSQNERIAVVVCSASLLTNIAVICLIFKSLCDRRECC